MSSVLQAPLKFLHQLQHSIHYLPFKDSHNPIDSSLLWFTDCEKKMKSAHFIWLAGTLVALGAMGSGLPNWNAVLTPSFIFGAMGVIGTQIGMAYTSKIGDNTK